MTTAQRARLVVAMGLLNLILATVALTAGFVSPTRQGGGIAVASPGPTNAQASPTTSSPGVATSPAPTTSSPAGSSSEPPASASAVPSSLEPTPIPSASTPVASEGPIVAGIPTPTPTTDIPQPTAKPTAKATAKATANPTPKPTVKPTPQPTVKPTPHPTATPEPVVGKGHKARPPCPDGTSGPPGHHKVTAPPDRPCGGRSPNGTHGSANGMVVVLPLVLGGLAATIRTRVAIGSRRLVRASRARADRRRRAGMNRGS